MAIKAMMMGAAGLALAFAAGCGSSVDDDDGAGAGGTGGGGVCAGFADEAGAGTVTVRFRNDSMETIYLPALCDSLDYTIEPAGGSDGVSYAFSGSCLQTCEDLQTESQIACGACQQTTYQLLPGATREVVWAGTGLQGGIEMPAACWESPETGGTCGRVVAAPAGTYRAGALGFGSCSGECNCDAEGLCVGSATGLEAYHEPVSFAFPTAAPVEVVFGVCTFGCGED